MQKAKGTLTTVEVAPSGQPDGNRSNDEADEAKNDNGYGVQSLATRHVYMTPPLRVCESVRPITDP